MVEEPKVARFHIPISCFQPHQSRNKLVRARGKRFWTLESSASFCLSADTSLYFNNCSGWVRWLSQTFEQLHVNLERYFCFPLACDCCIWGAVCVLLLCWAKTFRVEETFNRNTFPARGEVQWEHLRVKTDTNSSHVKTNNFWLQNDKISNKKPRF